MPNKRVYSIIIFGTFPHHVFGRIISYFPPCSFIWPYSFCSSTLLVYWPYSFCSSTLLPYLALFFMKFTFYRISTLLVYLALSTRLIGTWEYEICLHFHWLNFSFFKLNFGQCAFFLMTNHLSWISQGPIIAVQRDMVRIWRTWHIFSRCFCCLLDRVNTILELSDYFWPELWKLSAAVNIC